jgi:hypothetical protein
VFSGANAFVAVPKWYENNTVLTISSVGGLLFTVYFFGFAMLLVYYKIMKPRSDARRAARAGLKLGTNE